MAESRTDDNDYFHAIFGDAESFHGELKDFFKSISERRGNYFNSSGDPDAHDDLEALLDVGLKCGMLEEACASGRRPCACNLKQRCSQPELSVLTDSEVSNCLAGDGHRSKEAQAKMSLKCQFAAGGCEDGNNCLCRLLEQCPSGSASDLTWTKVLDCAPSMGSEDEDDSGAIHITQRDAEASDEWSKDCSTAFDLCRRGQSRCACQFTQRCHRAEGLSDRALKQLRRCLESDTRNAPRDKVIPSHDSANSLSKGAVGTFNVAGATVAISVSKASPTVWVVTSGQDDDNWTLVDSVISANPPIHAMTGVKNGKPTATTGTVPMLWDGLEERDMHGLTSVAQAGTAFSFTEAGTTGGVSIAGSDSPVLVATYGDESDAGTLVMSAIETDPPAIAVSGTWNDVVLPPMTMERHSPQDWYSSRELIEKLLEEEDASPNHVRRDSPALTPGFVTTKDYQVNGQPASVVYSAASTSPLVLVEKYYDGDNVRTHTQTFPASIAPPMMEGDTAEDDENLDKRAAPPSSSTSVAIASSSAASWFRTTDAEGNPIYVTRAGEYAARTTTLTFSSSVPAATTTRKGGIVEYRVVTVTHTIHGHGHGHWAQHTPMRADKTVLKLGGTEVPITNTEQTVNGTVIRFADPQATLKPLRHVHNDPAPYAAVTHLDRHNVGHYFNAAIPTVVRLRKGGVLHNMTAQTQIIHGTPVVMDPLARYQQYDARHHRVVPTPNCMDTHGVYRLFRGWGKKECMIEKCMWSHMKPLEIQTVFPAALRNHECNTVNDYFTQKTTLEEPHWGTTASRGTYYPVEWGPALTTTVVKERDDTTYKHAYSTCSLTRRFPYGFDAKAQQNAGAHGDPACSDMESCHGYCKKHHGPSLPHSVLLALMISLPLLLGIPFLALLCCLLPYWLFRRHRNRKEKNDTNAEKERKRRPSVMEKLRRKSTGRPDTVVNAVTGQATDPATGRPAEGGPGAATAIMAGSAAGAAAAAAGSGHGHGEGGADGGAGGDHGTGNASGDGDGGAKVIGGGDDGKGTLGRQAEEGRSRVRFDEAPKEAAEAMPKVVPVGGPGDDGGEPPKTDGTTESASGREWVDVGSMRGRKTKRPGEGLN